jgi:hypothetical protein
MKVLQHLEVMLIVFVINLVALTNYGEALKIPIDNMHFAGTETAEEWSGYMSGAVQAGERAAAEVIDKIEGKVRIPRTKKQVPSRSYKLPIAIGVLAVITYIVFRFVKF